MRKMLPTDEILDVLVCEIGARPRGAPTFDDVAPHMRSLHRDAAAITLEFDDAARENVERLAAAERLCCPGIEWLVESDPVRLRIGASPAQLDTLEQMLRQPT